MSAQRLRPQAAFLLGLLGVLLVLGGGLLIYGARQAFDSSTFADMAASSLADPRVSNYVADEIVNVLLDQRPDLIRVRPILHATAKTIVSSEPFRAIARQALLRAHELALTNPGQEILLTVSDLSLVLENALENRPDLAARIPDDFTVTLAALDNKPFLEATQSIMSLGKSLRGWGRRTFLLGTLLLIASVAVAVDFRYALLRIGLSLVAAAVLLMVGVELGAPSFRRLTSDPALGGALGGVWDTFVSRLRPRTLILGSVGLLLSAASTALLQRMDLRAVQHAIANLLWEPTENQWQRAVRIIVYLSIGWTAILEPTHVARLSIMFAGGLIAFVGLREFFLLVLPEVEKMAAPSGRHSISPLRRHASSAIVLALVVGLAVVGGYFFSRPEAVVVAESTRLACNGSPSLCDKKLDQVVFPAAHNAMGASDVPGWMFPNHTYGIPNQLERGIRGFLIDVYPGYVVGDRVKTDLEEGVNVADKLLPVLGEEGVAAATRIRDRLIVGEDSKRDLFMCHGMCEIGASRLVPALQSMRRFLILNPGEVLIIVVEDYVTPVELAAAFAESQLLDMVYTGPAGPSWPTLAMLIGANQRVLVAAENNADGVAWLHAAFDLFQETPYHTESAEAFSCEANRGGTTGSLLQINHWVVSPPTSLPSDAAVVNDYDFLLQRALRCQQERGMLPNLIAVDFADIGDLVRVTNTLNGLD